MVDTLSQAYNLWTELEQKSGTDLKYLRSSLKLYLFEGLKFNTRGMTNKEFLEFCDNLGLSLLAKTLKKVSKQREEQQGAVSGTQKSSRQIDFTSIMLNIFDEQFDIVVLVGKTRASTKSNYRSALGRFVKWLSKQSFWQILNPTQIPEVRPPRVQKGKQPHFRKDYGKYALGEEDLAEEASEELRQFRKFRITGGEDAWKKLCQKRIQAGQPEGTRPRLEKVKSSHFDESTKIRILEFAGWCVKHANCPLQSFRLQMLTDTKLLREFSTWLTEERGCCHCSSRMTASVGVSIAKWMNFEKTQRRNWSDVEIIMQLRDLCSEFQDLYKKEKIRTDKQKWENKKVSHEQLRQICDYLLELCASCGGMTNQSTGERVRSVKRSNAVIVHAYQVYTIVSLLTYMPVRQGEIRCLKEKLTLFRKEESVFSVYEVHNINHKLEHLSEETREYRVPRVLSGVLDTWIHVYRPMAQQAIQSLDDWLEFAGYKLEDVERIHKKLEKARQNELYKGDRLKYIRNLEDRLRALNRRIAAWPIAKANFEQNDSLFFMPGRSFPESFGKPLSSRSLRGMVITAISEASKALFGREYWLNPHAFRHIAALHVRQIQGDKYGLSILMNHAENMGEEYADQIRDGIDKTKNLDDWWEKKVNVSVSSH
jgi:hypothetical protein